MTFKNRPAHSLWPLITGFALLLLAVGGATAVSIAQQKQSLYVRAALERENNLNRILGLVTDAETGQRGYLLTGKDAYLDPYLAAKRDLLAEIDVLAPQIREFGSNSRIAELRQAASDKLAELKSTIDARRAGRADDALGILNSDRGLQLMQRIRESVAAMRQRSSICLGCLQSSKLTSARSDSWKALRERRPKGSTRAGRRRLIRRRCGGCGAKASVRRGSPSGWGSAGRVCTGRSASG